MDQIFDVIIAGGGPAGVLAAARLSEANPQLRIVILEKENTLGGRLKVSSAASKQHSYGLNAASDQLFDFWNQTLKSLDADAPDLQDLVSDRQTTFGVFAGGRIISNDITQWFTAKGARTLGGLTASRQWGDVDDVVKQMQSESTDSDDDDTEAEASETSDEAAEPEEASTVAISGASKREAAPKEHPFSHYWKKQRKAPAAVVLEHYAAAYGVPDLWSSATQALVERANYHSSRLHRGAWDKAFLALTESPTFKERVTVATGCHIVDADFEEDQWHVETVGGTYKGKRLIVAQPPWQAITWLPRTYWPANVLHIVSKTKPVSVVVLSEKLLDSNVELPDVTIVPAERTQILRNSTGEICFQATIDFELSLQAPAVIKAVRALKRARKKLLAMHPGLVSESNHIALHPVGWAQSPIQRDRRWLGRLAKKEFNTAVLAFCGDAYGQSYDGDANLVKSLVAACVAVSQDV
jgi:predicted NAD/FAD-dependent oxidoreductase